MEKTMVMTGDLTLTAYYEVYSPPPVTHSLVVTSTPISGFAIAVDGYQYTTPTQPITLKEGMHTVVAPSNVLVGSDVYNFKHWEDNSTTPARTFDLTANMTVVCTYELPPPPPPTKGRLSIHAFLDSDEIMVPYEIIRMGLTGITPDIVELYVGTYEVKATWNTQIKTESIEVLSEQTVRVDFQFAVPPPTPKLNPAIASGSITLLGLIIASVASTVAKR